MEENELSDLGKVIEQIDKTKLVRVLHQDSGRIHGLRCKIIALRGGFLEVRTLTSTYFIRLSDIRKIQVLQEEET